MNRRSRYAQEVRERTVRMVFEHAPEYGSQWAAIRSVSEVFGASPETLRTRVRRTSPDSEIRSRLRNSTANRRGSQIQPHKGAHRRDPTGDGGTTEPRLDLRLHARFDASGTAHESAHDGDDSTVRHLPVPRT